MRLYTLLLSLPILTYTAPLPRNIPTLTLSDAGMTPRPMLRPWATAAPPTTSKHSAPLLDNPDVEATILQTHGMAPAAPVAARGDAVDEVAEKAAALEGKRGEMGGVESA
ncbi:hypothetical protein H2201_003670 [Coniosporium apollinis]|uniref:Uncharacterized protein n=1 Tax=Coniosporium apollinis TaxID=61459 RepID=A0ABQ9NX21_9PEZI|nr:hypothetical protein H2201_003670 [Coniosporium apollinis]